MALWSFLWWGHFYIAILGILYTMWMLPFYPFLSLWGIPLVVIGEVMAIWGATIAPLGKTRDAW